MKSVLSLMFLLPSIAVIGSKRLAAIVLFSGLIGYFATVKAAENEELAPELATPDPTLTLWDIPELEKAFIDPKPANRDDGIPVGELGVDGGNKDIIVKLAQEIADGKYGIFDSLLIAHKGKLLFESYYLHGRINQPHGQASATKSYTSLAIGRAIQLGYLTMADLDKPLISFLKNLDTSKLVDGAELITLHKAMSMRSGIRISEEQRKKFEKNPGKLKGQGQVQVLLENSQPISLESQSFLYGGDPELVMQVLDAVVPGTAKDFIEKELLNKLGITNYAWQTNVSGLPEAGWRVKMTSRDMIKWGTLVMNRGKWNGEQLIPEEFIAKATHRIVSGIPDFEDIFFVGGNVSNAGYGYFWWQSDMKAGNKSYFAASANGGGGQYIILIEELDLIVVTTGFDGESNPIQLTADRILPAFIQ